MSKYDLFKKEIEEIEENPKDLKRFGSQKQTLLESKFDNSLMLNL